ncbi:zinc ABC transporter substrate-binding protein [Verrucomicrobiales bacterium BCK34]|nr:zinc ABC transporter substrate-binding protein [Verrucomicrobiales bacterium BCK34]
MRIPLLTPFILLICSAFLAGCGDVPQANAEEKSPERILRVFCSNYPLFYFTERIGGDFVVAEFPVPPDTDPAFWKPSEKDLIAMQSAGLLVTNGATYEKWIATVSMPQSRIVDTSKSFKGEYIASKYTLVHTHGGGEAHSHAGTEFSTWLDFQQAIWQAEEVRDALTRFIPEKAAAFEESFHQLAIDLEKLHLDFAFVGSAIDLHPLVASHPVYSYFSRRYKLNIESVHWEPETVPDEAALGELKALLKNHPAKWMIWEGEPVPESVALLKELGLESVVINPCGNRPESGDFLSAMKQNLANLRKISL